MKRVLLCFLALVATLGSACARREALPPDTEIRLLGGRGAIAIAADGKQGAALLAEVQALIAAARPGAGALTRREVALALDRGALELRFGAEQRFALASGDSLAAWRLLLVLGVEPPPPGGGTGLLILAGGAEYEPRPLVSARPRERLLTLLEGR